MSQDGTVRLIEARGLRRYYRRGSEWVKAVDGVDLEVHDGEMLSILGPSGSGKTTLVHLLSCLDAPTGGTLSIMGRTVTGLREDELTRVRRGLLGFVFQKFYLLPTLNVAENIELPLLFHRLPVNRRQTMEVLRQVRLEDCARSRPHELSGGQMQRVAIARALIVKPRILIADEPTGNLDSENGEAVFGLFRSLVCTQGIAVLVTTHNLSFGYLADRIVTLRDGKVAAEEAGPRPAVPAREPNV